MRTSTPEKNSSVVAHPKWESKINKGPPLLAGAKVGMPLNYTGQPWSQITYAASPRTTPPLWRGPTRKIYYLSTQVLLWPSFIF